MPVSPLLLSCMKGGEKNMSEFIQIGKVSRPHGIKGEIRLISDFELKKKVFIPGFKIYFGEYYEEFTITGYRPHKNFDMVTLEGITDINQILKYRAFPVYVKRIDLGLKSNDFLIKDLLNMAIYENNEFIGKIEDIVYNKANILLKVYGIKYFYIPYNDEYISSVDINKKIIHVKGAKELII